MEELVSAGLASLMPSGSGTAKSLAPELAQRMFSKALWLRVAVRIDDETTLASENLLESAAGRPAVLSLLALPALTTSAWLRGEACVKVFGEPIQAIAAPVLSPRGEDGGAVLVGIPALPLMQDVQSLMLGAESFAAALGAAGLVGKCAALIDDTRHKVQRSCEGARPPEHGGSSGGAQGGERGAQRSQDASGGAPVPAAGAGGSALRRRRAAGAGAAAGSGRSRAARSETAVDPHSLDALGGAPALAESAGGGASQRRQSEGAGRPACSEGSGGARGEEAGDPRSVDALGGAPALACGSASQLRHCKGAGAPADSGASHDAQGEGSGDPHSSDALGGAPALAGGSGSLLRQGEGARAPGSEGSGNPRSPGDCGSAPVPEESAGGSGMQPSAAWCSAGGQARNVLFGTAVPLAFASAIDKCIRALSLRSFAGDLRGPDASGGAPGLAENAGQGAFWRQQGGGAPGLSAGIPLPGSNRLGDAGVCSEGKLGDAGAAGPSGTTGPAASAVPPCLAPDCRKMGRCVIARTPWLTFRDAELEQRFCLWQARRLVASDMFGVLFYEVANVIFMADASRRAVFFESGCFWAFGLAGIAHTGFCVLAPRRVVLHTREVAVSVFVVLILAMTSATVAGQLAATLSPTQRSLYWFMRCICVELQCVFAVVFPTRFVAAVPVRLSCAAWASLHVAKVCQSFLQLWPSAAWCFAGGQALNVLVGTAVPLAIAYALDWRARTLFLRDCV